MAKIMVVFGGDGEDADFIDDDELMMMMNWWWWIDDDDDDIINDKRYKW